MKPQQKSTGRFLPCIRFLEAAALLLLKIDTDEHSSETSLAIKHSQSSSVCQFIILLLLNKQSINFGIQSAQYLLRIIKACPSSLLLHSSTALASRIAKPNWKMALIPSKKKQSTTFTALSSGMILRKRVRNHDRETEASVERSFMCSASSGRRSLINSSNTDWST